MIGAMWALLAASRPASDDTPTSDRPAGPRCASEPVVFTLDDTRLLGDAVAIGAPVVVVPNRAQRRKLARRGKR